MKSGTKQTVFMTPLHFGGNYCTLRFQNLFLLNYDLQAKEFTKTKFKGLHLSMSLKCQNC